MEYFLFAKWVVLTVSLIHFILNFFLSTGKKWTHYSLTQI